MTDAAPFDRPAAGGVGPLGRAGGGGVPAFVGRGRRGDRGTRGAAVRLGRSDPGAARAEFRALEQHRARAAGGRQDRADRVRRMLAGRPDQGAGGGRHRPGDLAADDHRGADGSLRLHPPVPEFGDHGGAADQRWHRLRLCGGHPGRHGDPAGGAAGDPVLFGSEFAGGGSDRLGAAARRGVRGSADRIAAAQGDQADRRVRWCGPSD